MKIKTKTLLVFLLFVIINLLLIKFAFHFLLGPVYISETKQHMEEYADQIKEAEKNGEDLSGIIADARDTYFIEILVAEEDKETISIEGDTTLFRTASEKETFLEMTKKCDVGQEYFYYTGKKKSREWKLYYILHPTKDHYVLLCKGLAGMVRSGSILTRFSFYAVWLFAFGIIILCLIITNNFVNRLNIMCRITDKMAHLEFDEKLMFKSHDEIGILASSIDTMSDELKENMDEMKKELQRRKNLVRNAAHDIRTPLTVIRGYAESIRVIAADQYKIQRYANIIVEECERMNSMTNGMLALNTISDAALYYKKEPLDMEELFQGIENRLKVMGQGSAVSCDYDKAVIPVSRDLIEYALFNMLDNAVKYGDKGKTIYLTGKIDGNRYIFTVKNSGAPMNEENIKYIWDALYKVDNSRKRGDGYGIGLAIVKQMALFHNGEVRAWSEDGYNNFAFSVSMEEPNKDE